ncbi:MAG TPA: hypothetical protein VF020_04325, partial [Chthoniobacterales bacterium]
MGDPQVVRVRRLKHSGLYSIRWAMAPTSLGKLPAAFSNPSYVGQVGSESGPFFILTAGERLCPTSFA